MSDQLRTRQGATLALVALALVLLPGLVTAGNWSANSVSELIGAINAANQVGGSNTISLAHGKTFTLTAVNNTSNGPTGLPVIAANNNLTILGNGATLARSSAPGTPAFRLFDVAPGAALTLENLTLANGLVIGAPGEYAYGGAIFIAAGGSLTASYTVFIGNQVVGGDGGRKLGGGGFGGAIRNQGVANLDHDTFSANQALGGATRNPSGKGPGGYGFGGAVASGNLGTLTVSNCRFSDNKGIGGLCRRPSAWGDGSGAGGAIDIQGTAWITDSTFTDNQAIGGAADEGVDGAFGVAGAVNASGPLAQSPVCTIQHCTFSHNQAIGSEAGSPGNRGGGGVAGALANGYAQNDSTMTISDCSFADNQALGGKGGLGGGFANGGAVLNESPPQGAIGRSIMTIANSTFTGSRAVGGGSGGSAEGGAILNLDWNADGGSGATLAISNCTFTGNQALGAVEGHGSPWTSLAFAQGGAVNTYGNTTIVNSTFNDNRAVGGTLLPGVIPNFYTASSGGGLSSWGGTLEVRDSSFVGNEVIGSAGSTGSARVPSSAGSIAMGGGITVFSGLTATIANCSLSDNMVVGGASGSGAPGGGGVGGGLNVGFYPYGYAIGTSTTVTITGTTISHNQAIGGGGGGEGLGGGYAVRTGVLFGIPDTSSVTLDGESRVDRNEPDDVFSF